MDEADWQSLAQSAEAYWSREADTLQAAFSVYEFSGDLNMAARCFAEAQRK